MLWGYGTFLVISVSEESEDESDDFELLLITNFYRTQISLISIP